MSRGKYRQPAVAPSRPDYTTGTGTGHVHDWTAPTPTSLRNQKMAQEMAQAEADARRVKQAQEQVQARSRALRERLLTTKELKSIAEQSTAGVVRGPEENQARNANLDRLATTAPRTKDNRHVSTDRFGKEKAEAIATRWATRGRR